MRFIIKGEDVTECVNNYYFDNEKNNVKIFYKGNQKEYTYKHKDIVIYPRTLKKIDSRQILIYKANHKVDILRDIYEYEEIGDGENSTIKVNRQGKVIYYKKHNIDIETFENYIVKYDEVVISDDEIKIVDTIEFSDSLVRIKYPDNEKIYIMNKDRIKIIKNMKTQYQDLFDYYKYIASIKDRGSEEYVDHYLESQLNEIVIQKNDLLDIYLSKKYDNVKFNYDKPVIHLVLI